jgi:hypothetical protein
VGMKLSEKVETVEILKKEERKSYNERGLNGLRK